LHQRAALGEITEGSPWPTSGVLVGTLVGRRVLTGIPELRFRRVVAIILGALGL
jgi:uncharacterized membrane protein YfcA